jgi:hypothetical protein
MTAGVNDMATTLERSRRFVAFTICAALVTASIPAAAQAPPNGPSESAVAEEDDPNFTGKLVSLGALGLVHATVYTWAYYAWYKGRTITDELVFRDEGLFGLDTYAGGADKFGHMWSNYALNRITAELLMVGGWTPGMASVIATTTTYSFFIAIELKDGVHKGFGFSWGDMIFNTLGEALAVVIVNYPAVDEMFDFKVEYNPTDLYLEKLYNDGVVDAAEDYTGQTFVLAYHFGSVESLRTSDRFGWMRYFDATLAYRAGNFLPPPEDPSILREQDLYVGFAINVQEIIDQTFYPAPIAGQQYDGGTHHLLHFIPELYGLPYTNLRVAGFHREAVPDLFGITFDDFEPNNLAGR